MAKEVERVEQDTVQADPYSLEREQVKLHCDDGSEYVFERPTDSPTDKFTLARRVKPDGELSTSKGILPASVKESMNTVTERLAKFGIERGWSK